MFRYCSVYIGETCAMADMEAVEEATASEMVVEEEGEIERGKHALQPQKHVFPPSLPFQELNHTHISHQAKN